MHGRKNIKFDKWVQFPLHSEGLAITFRNLPVLLRWVVSPDPLNGGPPLLSVCDFPFNTPAVTTHDCRLSPPSTTSVHAMSSWQQTHKVLWLLVIIPFWYLQRLLTISKCITSDYLFSLPYTLSKDKPTLFINLYIDSTKATNAVLHNFVTLHSSVSSKYQSVSYLWFSCFQ